MFYHEDKLKFFEVLKKLFFCFGLFPSKIQNISAKRYSFSVLTSFSWEKLLFKIFNFAFLFSLVYKLLSNIAEFEWSDCEISTHCQSISAEFTEFLCTETHRSLMFSILQAFLSLRKCYFFAKSYPDFFPKQIQFCPPTLLRKESCSR